MSNVDAFGKAGFGHKREPHARGGAPVRRRTLDGIVCNAVAGAAILFVAALVLGLIG
ncbi:hypothetical protein [Mycoplana sp. MJR14]|uniref:hypothetical protein n=1 Tax=Mycoplana sp. MJR14 TaxID=3032583 RepID=UPI0013AECE2E|nr:hypothetical protein [Mycoplana sp. MJR14]MDF1632500.1 hypothetical protein [Mycoplana sp. MJR14]